MIPTHAGAMELPCVDSTTWVVTAAVPQLCVGLDASRGLGMFLKNLNIREELSKVWREKKIVKQPLEKIYKKQPHNVNRNALNLTSLCTILKYFFLWLQNSRIDCHDE